MKKYSLRIYHNKVRKPLSFFKMFVQFSMWWNIFCSFVSKFVKKFSFYFRAPTWNSVWLLYPRELCFHHLPCWDNFLSVFFLNILFPHLILGSPDLATLLCIHGRSSPFSEAKYSVSFTLVQTICFFTSDLNLDFPASFCPTVRVWPRPLLDFVSACCICQNLKK